MLMSNGWGLRAFRMDDADYMLTNKLKSWSYLRFLMPIKLRVPGVARRSARHSTDVMLIFVGDSSKDITIVLTIGMLLRMRCMFDQGSGVPEEV